MIIDWIGCLLYSVKYMIIKLIDLIERKCGFVFNCYESLIDKDTITSIDKKCIYSRSVVRL